ncbi:hypothetical protein CTheo_5252 [Ceratobasidium theobromae]|uniref:ERCC1-like central domain-containing protein n=1 Tax=Ceratobasidium theobromae TaxID=1582974 RepID=A0A5N5QIC9_9AGAM|nr:hypothetical protein CTheo_5252 [Ceratobasidium theobromae]
MDDAHASSSRTSLPVSQNALAAKAARSTVGNSILVHKRQTEHQNSIKELTKACLMNNITVIVAWSVEEAGRYLATYKLYEFKSHQLIKERVDTDYISMLRTALTTVRGVNKTDVMTLRTNFGSFSNIAHATTEDLQLCPGFGPTKVRRLREAFNKPFYSTGQEPLRAQNAEPGVDASGGILPDPDKSPQKTHDIDPTPPATFASPPSCPIRHSSPEWDIETIQAEARTDDPDLSLELNPSDEDG